MQPAQFFVLCALALAAIGAAVGVQERLLATGQVEEQITGSTPVLVSLKTGEPLTCEQIRHMDEVELITDDSYCG